MQMLAHVSHGFANFGGIGTEFRREKSERKAQKIVKN